MHVAKSITRISKRMEALAAVSRMMGKESRIKVRYEGAFMAFVRQLRTQRLGRLDV